MMFNLILVSSSLVLLLLFTYLIPYLRSPLRKFPGPFFAHFTDLWRFHKIESTHRLQIELHRKHGQAVRVGPNHISLSDPKLIKTIYNTRGTFLKSDFYTINDVLVNGHIIQNIFGTRSNEWHRKYTRPIQQVYSMKSILTLEQLADRTSEVFCRRLEEEFINGANSGTICNLSEWISFYAWDVDGVVTFDQPFGFLEKGADMDNWMRDSEKALAYLSRASSSFLKIFIGQIPALDAWLAKNPYIRLGALGPVWAATYCTDRLVARYEELAALEKQGKKPEKDRADFLDYFIALKAEHPEVVDDFTVVSYMILNVLAGADTTTVTLRAIFYFLLKNPKTYSKLVAELDASELQHPVPYSMASKLPYLDAVVHESMRLYPAVAMMLERVVPEGGLTLSDGREIPAGTTVGMNPWVIGHTSDIFGTDLDTFLPERWLQNEGEDADKYKARLQAMKSADLSFGAGNRICIGKNMALVEMYKIIPTLLLKYKFELADPDEEWTVTCKWLAFQGPINVKLDRRDKV